MTEKKAHPPSTKIVIFWTKDGEKHHGFFMTRGNKFTPITNRWKDASTEKWYDDDEIINWKYFEHYPEED